MWQDTKLPIILKRSNLSSVPYDPVLPFITFFNTISICFIQNGTCYVKRPFSHGKAAWPLPRSAAHYPMSIRSKVIYWTRLTSTRKEHAAVREGDSREQNFRFQRRDIEVAIHRSVQSSTSLPFFPKLLLLIGLLFAIISLFLTLKQRPVFHLEKNKIPAARVRWLSLYSARSAREYTHTLPFTDRKPRPSIKQQVKHFVISTGWQLEVRIYKAADRRLANHQSHSQLWTIQFLHIQPKTRKMNSFLSVSSS